MHLSADRVWTPEEDELILELVAGFDRQVPWKTIQNRFTDRTRSSIRNRYQRIRKGEKIRNEGGVGGIRKAKNRCHACGELRIGHVCKAKMVSTAVATLAAAATTVTTASQFETSGFSVEESDPSSIPLVLQDLFPPTDIAVGQQYRPDPSVRGGLPLLSGISSLVESPPKRVTPLFAYLDSR